MKLHMRSKTPLKPVDWARWTKTTQIDDLDLPADVRAQLHSSGCRHIDKEVPL